MNRKWVFVNTCMRTNQAVKIAVIIRALRNAFGLSQTELASLAKCSRPTINRIESLDNSSPRSDTVDELIQVFRDRGAEIQIGDDYVVLRFTKEALVSAEQGITGEPASD